MHVQDVQPLSARPEWLSTTIEQPTQVGVPKKDRWLVNREGMTRAASEVRGGQGRAARATDWEEVVTCLPEAIVSFLSGFSVALVYRTSQSADGHTGRCGNQL
jgi:hypothetical protein